MIRLENVTKSYRSAGVPALSPTTFEFPNGTTTVLIGPSGCGKSTLLRLIVGLISADSGRVLIDNRVMTPDNALELRHRIGYVIQDGGLFPHLTARQNAALLSQYLKMPSDQIRLRVNELAEITQLPGSALERYPAELSGGQRQRVGLIRALMLDPPTLLLDEPLGALDAITRNELQNQLKAIFQGLKKTVVLVTHDLAEAAFLGDTIALMRDGRIVQSGTLAELSETPAESYVGEFLRAQRRSGNAAGVIA